MRQRIELKGGILKDPAKTEFTETLEAKVKELCKYVIEEGGRDIDYFDLECLLMRTVYGSFVDAVLKDGYNEILKQHEMEGTY